MSASTTVFLLAILLTACAPSQTIHAPATDDIEALSDPQKAVALVSGAVSLGSPEGLDAKAWVPLEALMIPGRDRHFEIPEPGYLKVGLRDYGKGCRVCRCFTDAVLISQEARKLELGLALVKSDPSSGLCRAMSMVEGTAILGPLAPGRWTLISEGHFDAVFFQPVP